MFLDKKKEKVNRGSPNQQSVFLNLIATQTYTPTNPFYFTAFVTILSSLNLFDSALYRFPENLWRNLNHIRWRRMLFSHALSPLKTNALFLQSVFKEIFWIIPSGRAASNHG